MTDEQHPLPEAVQQLDEAYPGMALADQVRAFAADEVAAERALYAAALRIAREGYASEAVTGLPVLPQWRERTIALIDAALKA